MTGCESPAGLCNCCAEAALVGGRVSGDFAFSWSSPSQVCLPGALWVLVAAAPYAGRPEAMLWSSRCCCPCPPGVLCLQLGSNPMGVRSL